MKLLLRVFSFIWIAGGFTCFLCSYLFAWPIVNGIAINTAETDQFLPQIAGDGSGGAIITWTDARGTTNNLTQGTDIYAQHVNTVGSTLWTWNGVAICTAIDFQDNPRIVGDGFGGAIITWSDARSTTDIYAHLYAQRVNSSGSTLWTTNGIAVSTSNSLETSPAIVNDGSGGAVITWYDYRNGNYDIFAQRVEGTGSTLWTTNGVAICTAIGFQYNPTIVSDGLGGAIITWGDVRQEFDVNVYAQRVNNSGSTLWKPDGVAICTAKDYQFSPQPVRDGLGGAIITWEDFRSTSTNLSQGCDIYAQRVNSNGSTLWTPDGVAICTANYNQYAISADCDGANGALISWWDFRNTTSTTDIYAQRVNSMGSSIWTPNGVAICTAGNEQRDQSIISDGIGGAIITWMDYRNTTASLNQGSDIYAQRVNSSGSLVWTLNGNAVCTAWKNQSIPEITSDGQGGAIISWHDSRNGNADIYAQRIYNNGFLDYPTNINNWKYLFNQIEGIKE